MAKFVYTVVYAPNGDFLMFQKNIYGYFFGNAEAGSIDKNPKRPLNGAGKVAFPGGAFEAKQFTDRNIISEGRREFIEECGRCIAFEDAEADEIIEIPIAESVEKFDGGKNTDYAAYYVEVSGEDLTTLWSYVENTTLEEARGAVKAIFQDQITDYDQIGAAFPNAPYDNELALAFVWNLVSDAEEIEKLQFDRDTDWFYQIIQHLAKLCGN